MRIKAQFNGKCTTCKKPLLKDREIEYVDRKAYCGEACVPAEQASLADVAEAAATCERLGFRTFDALEREGIPASWRTLSVVYPAVRDDTGRDASPTLFE
jgi:hypothetical protein